MKKILSILIMVSLTTTMIFAKSKKASEADSYEDNVEITDSETSSEDDIENDKAPFFGSSTSQRYIRGDEITINTFNAINKLKQTDAVITYNNKTQTFGYGSTYLAAYYIVLFDEKGRDTLQKAYDNYLQDFSNKKLNRKDKKSQQAYGKVSVNLNWGTIKASTPNKGIVKASLGYQFIDNSPYFILSALSTFNEYSVDNESVSRESIPVKYAFTKAQMAALLEAISDEEINKLLPNKITVNTEADVYSDEE